MRKGGGIFSIGTKCVNKNQTERWLCSKKSCKVFIKLNAKQEIFTSNAVYGHEANSVNDFIKKIVMPQEKLYIIFLKVYPFVIKNQKIMIL